MKNNHALFLLVALIFVLNACSFAGDASTPLLVSTTGPAPLQEPQAGATSTSESAPTDVVTPTPSVLWPTNHITVNNVNIIQRLQSWGQGRVDDVFQNADSDYLVVFGAGTVTVYQAGTLTQLYQVSGVQAVAVSFSANVLVTTYQGLPGKETPIKIHDLKSGEVRAEVSHKLDRYFTYASDDVQRARNEGQLDVTGLALSPDGNILVAGFGDGRLEAWDIKAAPVQVTRQQYEFGPSPISFSPSGKNLLVGSLMLYQFPEMKLIQKWQSFGVVPIMPDQRTMLVAEETHIFQVDITTGEELATIPIGTSIQGLKLSGDGKKLWVYTYEVDQDTYHHYRRALSVPEWEVVEEKKEVGALNRFDPDARPPFTEIGHIPALEGVDIVNGNIIAWGMYGNVPFWWTPVDDTVSVVQVPEEAAHFFHYQDQSLLTCEAGNVSIWDTGGQTTTIKLKELTDCDRIAMNNQGDTIAVAAGPDIWFTNPDNTRSRYLQESAQSFSRLTFSQDDSVFAAGTVANYQVPGDIFFWNGTVGYPISRALFPEDKTKNPKPGEVILERDAADIRDVLISGDNSLAVTFSENIRIWDIQTGKQTGFIPYDEGAVTWVGAISPDKSLLVLGDRNGQLHFWDLEKMVEISVLADNSFLVHKGSISSIIFNREGTAMLTAGEDGKVYLWGIP